MPVAITVVPATPEAAKDFCRVTVTDATVNDIGSYDNTVYPSSPELRYYLTFELGGTVQGKSYVFAVNSGGDHEFNNYMFPTAGSWTVRLSDAETDGSVATQAVTVS